MKGSGSSDNQTPSKCFSGILRGLLCAGSLPTHPSDQFNLESNKSQIVCRNPEKCSESEGYYNHVNKQAATSSKPGVVARLMGLESLPASPLPLRQKTLGSYFRSRSVNSIDFLSQLDPVLAVQQGCHRRHRRVRTSVSFREVPSLLVLDDRFSVVFPLEEVDESAECGEDNLQQLVARKTSVIDERGKMEKRVRRKSRNGEKFVERTVKKKLPTRKMEPGEARRSVSATPKKGLNGRTSVNLKERRAVINKPAMDSRERRPTVKKKRVHGVKKIHPEPTGTKRRGEVSSHEMCSISSSNKHSSSQKNGEIRAITKSKTRDKKASNECENVVEEVFRLTQESVDEDDCDWTDGQISKFEDFEDMCVQFGGQILELLLNQIVDELVLLYGIRT